MDITTLTQILSYTSPVIISILGFFLKQSFGKIDKQDNNIESLKQEITNIKLKQESLSSHHSVIENKISFIEETLKEIKVDLKDIIKEFNKKH